MKNLPFQKNVGSKVPERSQENNEVVSFKFSMILIDATLLFFSWFTLGGSVLLFDALNAFMGGIQGLAIIHIFPLWCMQSEYCATNMHIRYSKLSSEVCARQSIDHSNLYSAHNMHSALIQGASLHKK